MDAVIIPPTIVARESESIKNIAAAMVEVQRVLEDPKKTSKNSFFGSSYSDLAEVRAAMRMPLCDNNVACFQFASVDYEAKVPRKVVLKDDKGNKVQADVGVPLVSLMTKLVHAPSGEWISMTLTAAPADDTVQAIGSIVTYLRRYGLKTLLGMADEDDDGNSASGRTPPPDAKKAQGKAPVGSNPAFAAQPEPQTKPGPLAKPADVKDLAGRVRWIAKESKFDEKIQEAEGLITTEDYKGLREIITKNLKAADGKSSTTIFVEWLRAVYGCEFYDIKKEMLMGIKTTLTSRAAEIQGYRGVQ